MYHMQLLWGIIIYDVKHNDYRHFYLGNVATVPFKCTLEMLITFLLT